MGRGVIGWLVFAKVAETEVLHIDQFERAGVEVTLGLVAEHLLKCLNMFFGFHSFGDDLDLKAVCECDDRSGDGTAVFVAVAARDDGPGA